MTLAFSPPQTATVARSTLLIEAARCWREARDAGRPVQPCLTAMLRNYACEILAPVFDSLMTLCEAALGRRLSFDATMRPSEDGRLLIGLLDGSRPRGACIECSNDTALALDCAICSTRIMMSLALAERAAATS